MAKATKKKAKRPAEKLSKWDPADHLKNDEEIAAYLSEIFGSGIDDPALIAAALGDAARAYGMMKLSKATGISRVGLYKALSKDGNPSLGTFLKVTKALGVRLTAEAA